MAGGPRETTEITSSEADEPQDGGASGDDTPEGGGAGDSTPGRLGWLGTDRGWTWALVAICALALVIRLVYLFGWQAVDEIEGDAYYYHAAANLLAEGEGFVHPYAWDEGVRVPGADHPPGYSTVLAFFSLLGFDSIRSHQVVTCLIGTGTVALMGVLGRRLAGARVGLMAAGFGAVYPNLWLNDPSLMSESLALLAGVAVSLAAYWAWDRPTVLRLAGLGALLGVATLVRAEAALLMILVVLPLCVWSPRLSGLRDRLQGVVVAGVALGLVVAPWVVPNLFRFEHPATISTQLGPTLEVANCDETYYDGPLGGWSFACASEIDTHDRSVLDQETQEAALEYMSENRGRLPLVLAARFGRTWGVYAPDQQLKIDVFTDSRPYDAARAGLALYYVTAAAAVVGVVALRRMGVPSFPLTAWVINVTITVLLFYGTTRFRAPAEPALVLLGAVGVNWLLVEVLPRRKGDSRSGVPADER